MKVAMLVYADVAITYKPENIPDITASDVLDAIETDVQDRLPSNVQVGDGVNAVIAWRGVTVRESSQ